MTNGENEQLRLASPEYAKSLVDLSTTAAIFMDDNPGLITYHRNASYLYVKTPGCDDNEHYQFSRGLPYPYPENPDWAAIEPKVTKVFVRDGGSSHTYTTYSENEGILLSNLFIDDNNEDSGEPALTRELSIEEVWELTVEVKKGTPFKKEPEVESRRRKGKAGRFLATVVQALTRNRTRSN